VAVAKNVSQGTAAVGALRESAGAIADEIIPALLGWTPRQDMRELRLGGAPRAADRLAEFILASLDRRPGRLAG
jgi:hypothetical protein